MSGFGKRLREFANLAQDGIQLRRILYEILKIFHDGGADDDSVGFPSQVVNLIGGANTETDSQGQIRLGSQ